LAAVEFVARALAAFVAVFTLQGSLAMAGDISAEVAMTLAPGGRLRAAINFGNPVLAQRDATSGQPRGVSADLARELGRRLGVPVDYVTFDGAGQVFDALKAHAWDVAFLAVDPVRAAEIDFTPPYVVIEGVYVVPRESPLLTVEMVDREGVRIAVGRGSAYDLYLTRALKHATLVRSPTSAEAIKSFANGGLDAVAGVKQPLAAFVADHPDTRLIPGRFMAIEQALGAPRGRDAGRLFLRDFVEKMKANGFIARALQASGQGEATVAPPSSAK
jgi:polar amino acid transport system substrate-binding protein